MSSARTLALLLFALLPAIARADDPWTWQPRAATIQVQPDPGAPGSVRVRGPIRDGYNYVASNRRPVTPGQLYRLTIDLRVDRLGPGTPPPYFKCEFVAAARGGSIAQVHTDPYDVTHLGQWQTVATEFRAPEGVAACWLALEKGTSGPAEIEASLRNVKLEPIARLSALEKYRLDPIPAPLKALEKTHPRLYLTDRRIAALKQALPTTHAAFWKELKAQADRLARNGPPSYRKDDGHSGDEQLWQREVGNAMPTLALVYVLSGEKPYLEAAQKWALASCGYPTWGLGRIDGMDLATGHQLLGLALVYDWCHRDLDPAARDTIRQTLARRASAMYQAAATGTAWWRRSYLQNHLWVDATGMAAAGFALYGEEPDAPCWIGFPLDAIRRSIASFGPDGASHEGVGYWEYGAEYLLKFMDLADTLLGVDLHDHPWWRNTSQYALHLNLPRNAWRTGNCIVDIADCPRTHWYGPDYMLRRLAARNRDGMAQTLAQAIDDANVSAPGAPWLNLLWFDPTVPPAPLESQPTFHHFADMGLVATRTGWTGDESLAVFKGGPFLGHEAVARFSYDPGGGHVHPDANHFVLFGHGEWLVRDDGYHAKWTAQHNTLLVDGRGQLGEGEQWFQGSKPLAVKARPRILEATTSPALDHVAGDATAAYPAALGLTRYVRHLLFLKPDVLIVADDLALDRPADLDLRFHPETAPEPDGPAFRAAGKASVLRIDPLTPDGVTAAATAGRPASRSQHDPVDLPAVRLTRHDRSWRNAVALSWCPKDGAPPPRVTLTRDADRWTFRTPHGAVTLDWSTGQAQTTP